MVFDRSNVLLNVCEPVYHSTNGRAFSTPIPRQPDTRRRCSSPDRKRRAFAATAAARNISSSRSSRARGAVGQSSQDVRRQYREPRVERTDERRTPFAELTLKPSVFFQNRRRRDDANRTRAPRYQSMVGHAISENPRHQHVAVRHDLHLARRTCLIIHGTSADLRPAAFESC